MSQGEIGTDRGGAGSGAQHEPAGEDQRVEDEDALHAHGVRGREREIERNDEKRLQREHRGSSQARGGETNRRSNGHRHRQSPGGNRP